MWKKLKVGMAERRGYYVRPAGRYFLAGPSKQNELRGGLATYTRRTRLPCAAAWQIMDQWQLPRWAGLRSDKPIKPRDRANFPSIPPGAPLHLEMYRTTMVIVPIAFFQSAGRGLRNVVFVVLFQGPLHLVKPSLGAPGHIAGLKFVFPFFSRPPGSFLFPSAHTMTSAERAHSITPTHWRCPSRKIQHMDYYENPR